MPYKAPVCVWVGGDGGDSNLGTVNIATPVQVGDFITVTVTTSDYLRNWNTISGGSVSTWYNGVALADVSGYGDAGVWGGWATQNGTFNVTMTFSGGNAGANYQQMRVAVWRGGVDGWGNSGSERKNGNSDFFLNTNDRGGQTAAVWCAVDWNAAGVLGTSQPGTVCDVFFAGGAARYWAGHTNALNSPTDYWVGNYGTGSSKVSGVVQEILGKWYDDTAPTVPTGVTAVMDKQGSATISWNASADNDAVAASGVKNYRVRRNGVDIVGATALTGLTYTDTAATLTDYYTVSVVDNNGNRSAESATASFAQPPFKLGSQTVLAMKAGALNVDRLYLGANRIWP